MILKAHLNALWKTVKYIRFSVPIKREVIKIDKDGKKCVKTISYKIKGFDSMRFMATLLTKLVDNFSEGVHKVKCKDCGCSLKYESLKNNLIKYKCYLVIKIIQESLMKNQKRNLRTPLSFPTIIQTNLFSCLETVFIPMIIWMIGKGLMR